jgi:hypothetical protein
MAEYRRTLTECGPRSIGKSDQWVGFVQVTIQ